MNDPLSESEKQRDWTGAVAALHIWLMVLSIAALAALSNLVVRIEKLEAKQKAGTQPSTENKATKSEQAATFGE